MQFIVALMMMCHAAGIREDHPTLTECRQGIVNHQADDSVPYKAGTTASGKKTKPADLPENRDFGLGKHVIIPLDTPLKNYAAGYTATPNTAVNETVNDSKIYTGVIDMQDGKIRINGESVSNPSEDERRAQCKKLYPELK